MNGYVNSTSLVRGSRTIPYDNSSGGWNSVEADMTLWVGSTSGTFDKGKVRVKSATSNQLVVAENEYIQWADNLHLTVVNYVDLVAIFPRLVQSPSDETVVNFYKDYDVVYTNQNSQLGAFVVAGSHRAGFLNENNRCNLYFSASGTFPMSSGSTTIGYAWSFPAGVIVTGTTGQTPGIASFTGTGHFAVKLVTTVFGGTNPTETTYRYVSIYDKPNRGLNVPIRQWTLSDLAGSRDDGGFRGKITVYEQLNYKLSGGELVVIFSEDEFNGTSQSIDIGTVRPDDSILFSGYIMNDSVEYDYEKSKVSFDIGSPSEMLKQGENFAISVESMANPSAWWHFYDMTTKKAMYHYVKWHSTLMKVADIFWLGKDYYVQYFDSERTNMWDAMKAFMKPTLIGDVSCNNKGQVVFQTEPESFTTPTLSYPKIMTLSDRDVVGQVDINENLFGEMSYLEMGGIQYIGALNGNNSFPLLSAAPGTAPRYYGKNSSNQGLALESQNNLNEITGNMYAKANANPQSFRAQMAGNYRFTLAPLNMMNVYVPASRTVQNKMVSGTYYANNINYNYDAEDGYLSSSVEFMQVVNGIPGATLEIKPAKELAPLTFPPLIFPTFSFGFGTNVKFVAALTDSKGLWFTDNFDSEYPIWYSSGIQFINYVTGLPGENPGTDTNLTLRRNLEISSSGLAVVCGQYGVYAGQIGMLTPIASTEDLIAAIGDYDGSGFKTHPKFYLVGMDDSGTVISIGGHVYASASPRSQNIWYGSAGGLTVGVSTSPEYCEGEGSATRGGGGWFVTYPDLTKNRWINTLSGNDIAAKGEALNGKTAGSPYTTRRGGQGAIYFHTPRQGAPASSVMTLTDEFDNETNIVDSGDSGEPSDAPSRLSASPAGQIMRFGTFKFRRSRDGGTTWSSVTGTFLPGTITNGGILNGKEDGIWIATTNSPAKVYYTGNDGMDWVDKTGNLGNYLSTDFNVVALRAIL